MSRTRKASRRKIKKSPFLGLICLGILICVSMAATIYLIFLRPGTHPQTEKSPAASPKVSLQKVMPSPVQTPVPAPATPEEVIPPPEEKTAEARTEGPQIALIIDDIGYQTKIAEKLIDLDLNLNFSILPHSPHGLKLAQKAHDKGRDILLHLPMEATDPKWDPGPGALFLKMDDTAMRGTLLKGLDAVPMAVGISNHMGSRYSENEEAMTAFFTAIKPKNLFFIDSLTSSKSIGYKLAKKMGVQTAKRDIFLDNDKDQEKIIKQIERLVSIAQKHGKAIGIGHPYPSTFEALIKSLPLLEKTGPLASIHNLVE
jgi:hypothetical protein